MRRSVSQKNYHFFARMLLICTILLAAFSLTVSVIIAHLSHQYEMSQYLKPYELASVNLSETFESHFSNFSILAGKVMNGNQCNQNLCALLEADSYEEVNPVVRNACIRLLSSICSDDRYLRGFLLYSENGPLYYYSDSQSYLAHVNQASPSVRPIPFICTPIPLDAAAQMILSCGDSRSGYNSFYGLSATIFRISSAPLGYLIPLYSISEYTELLSNFDLSQDSVFRITDLAGNLFFDSNPSADTQSGSWYRNSIINFTDGFQVSYYAPDSYLPENSITRLSLLLAILLTLFAFVLYYVTYYLSSRNINLILDGMKRFQLDDLTYRISGLTGRNEFAQISDAFNAMCDELQKNVEQSYVYELQQKKSELYALQTSINPHFLYNTLEIIRSQLINGNADQASRMILILSKIYRTQTGTGMFATLDQEIELCENLMILYQHRFQNFDYEFEPDSAACRFALPKNTLQPLIENYFVHGIISERQDNFITLSASVFVQNDRQYIRLTLSNNGKPIDPEQAAQLEKRLSESIYSQTNTNGFALTNVLSRLRIVFQNDCSLRIVSPDDPDMSFCIELIFPAKTAEQLKESF